MQHRNILQLILFVIVVLFSNKSNGQYVTAFTDNRGNLQIFDRGMIKQVEYLPVRNYKIGGNSVAYIDNKNDFKVYYDGNAITLVNAADFKYFMTDYLTAFKVGDVLYAFDRGEKKTLCYYTSRTIFTVNDSLIAYYDELQSALYIYYEGKLLQAEESLLSLPKAISAGSNIVAWVNQSDIFNIFYHGKTTTLDNVPPIAFEAGQDIAAYIDGYEQRFHLFYKGDTAMVEEFVPDSFKVGFGIAAYVDNLGNFSVFSDGAISKVLSNRPRFFYVKGNVVVYYYNNTFNVFYKGQVYNLQNVAPSDFQLGNNGIAWIDDSGRLQLFEKGKTYTVSYEIINKYDLNGDVLKYEVGVNTTKVFYQGKNY